MSKRYHETPMDFEYQNGTGPMDAKSPFAAVSMNAQRFPATPGGGGNGNRKSVFSFAWKKDDSKNVTTATDAASKGDYNAFDSPTRPGASRNPSPNKALPPVPGFHGVSAFNAMFTTPRKTMQDTHMEDSSAGETPKSPERQDDSEAGTPAEKLAYERRRLGGGLDTRSAPAIPTVATLSMSPSKEMGRERTRERERERERRDRRPSPGGKKESFFGRVKRSFNSPGRGEVPRADSQNRDHRVRRQKSQRSMALALQRRYSDDPESGEEADDSELTIPPQSISPRKRSAKYNQEPPVEPQQTQQPLPQSQESLISSIFTFIGAHPTVPHILSFYAQLFFNVFLLSGCAYIIYSFWSAVRGDVDRKAFEASADIIATIVSAKEQYEENRCASSDRVPALKSMCAEWERIMTQDPLKIARAKVSAHTFAEIFNSFVEPISYKAMLFTAMIVLGCFGVSNFAFGVLRNKAMEQQHTQQHWGGGPYNNFQAPPPTPQRSFSGLVEAHQGTPWHGGPALEPAPSQRYDLGDGQGSPRRRLVYN
jgi:hypothetical protein